MNIKEIAKLAGVSVATVSRVINTPSAVSDKTRERVQKIMEEQNYKPNVFARGLNAKSTNTVGILCPEMNDINHARVISILERLLRSHGFDCLLYCTGSYLPYTKKNLELLAAKQVAAILAVGSACDSENDKAAFRAVAQQIPVIVLNGLVSAPGVYNIFCDEERAVRDLTAELIRSGCRSLYFIEDNSTFSAHQKRTGFLKAIRAAGIERQCGFIKVPLDTHELMHAKKQVESLISKGVPIDAILSADDILAVGALQALNAAGMRIPVVGFNDSDYAICCTPYLSSINNRSDFICKIAVDTLNSLLSGEEALDRVSISAKLVERETYVRGASSSQTTGI